MLHVDAVLAEGAVKFWEDMVEITQTAAANQDGQPLVAGVSWPLTELYSLWLWGSRVDGCQGMKCADSQLKNWVVCLCACVQAYVHMCVYTCMCICARACAL